MLTFLRSTTLAAAVAAAAIFNAPREASAAFNVDCAMLLCLAGGWPESAECSLAYATLIRRVTPWPIEPPLQIWRCPMGAAYEGPAAGPMQRLYEAMSPRAPMRSQPEGPMHDLAPQPAVMRINGGEAERMPEGFFLNLVQNSGTAEQDIGNSVFDFVRSIHVFDVTVSQREQGSDRNCVRRAKVRRGSYGTQGDFHWHRSSVSAIPAAHIGTEGFGESACSRVYNRSVFVEWRDHSGRYGSEQVNY